MKKLRRDPLRFDAFGLFATYGSEQRLSLRGESVLDDFLASIKSAATAGLANEAFLQGQRTEALFERILVGLGECRLVKREDAGSIFYRMLSDINVPDFRVILHDGTQVLIEVKNFYQGQSPTKDFKCQSKYIDGLLCYARETKCELRIAIYWVRWNMWTLVRPSALQREGDRYTLSLGDAIIANEMSLVGDVRLGTRPPLRIRLIPAGRPPTVDTNGQCRFKIGSREIYSEDRILVSPTDQKIALYLSVFGDWRVSEPIPELEDNRLVAVENRFEPFEDDGGLTQNGFSWIGSLSGMISRHYQILTGSGEQVDSIQANYLPGDIGQLIPPNYASEALPLWIFRLSPSEATSPPA